MKTITLTELDGSPVVIGVAWVQAVKKPRAADYVNKEVHAIVMLSGCDFAVKETVEAVRLLLEGSTED